jgi:hypothetical protein
MLVEGDRALREALLSRARSRGADRLRLSEVARKLGVDTLVVEAFVGGAKLTREAMTMLPTILGEVTRSNDLNVALDTNISPNRSPASAGIRQMNNTLTARALKCTAVLDPAEIAALPDPATARVTLHIRIADGSRTISADIAAKSLRKAKAAIAEHGVGGVAVIIQGKLVGETLTEAGLTAQAKVPKGAETAA